MFEISDLLAFSFELLLKFFKKLEPVGYKSWGMFASNLVLKENTANKYVYRLLWYELVLNFL